MIGRPSDYSEAVVLEICELIAEGEVLTSICKREGMPHVRTAMRWLRDHDDFRQMYTLAREARADIWGEEILDIADNATNDWIERQGNDGDATRVVDHEHIARSRLRVDARKWLMAKASPRKYGERLDLNHGGGVTLNPPLDYSGLTQLERDQMRALAMKAEATAKVQSGPA